MNFNLINLMSSSRARKLVNSLFCMNFSKNQSTNIDQIVENFKQIFLSFKKCLCTFRTVEFIYVYVSISFL